MTTKRIYNLTPIVLPGTNFADGTPVRFPVARRYGAGWVRIDYPGGEIEKVGRGENEKARLKVARIVSELVREHGYPVLPAPTLGANAVGINYVNPYDIPIMGVFSFYSWRDQWRLAPVANDTVLSIFNLIHEGSHARRYELTCERPSEYMEDPNKLRSLILESTSDEDFWRPAGDITLVSTGDAKRFLDGDFLSSQDERTIEKLSSVLEAVFGIDLRVHTEAGALKSFAMNFPTGKSGSHSFSFRVGHDAEIQCEWFDNQNTWERETRSRMEQFLAGRKDESE